VIGGILILLNAFTPGNRAGESARNASLGLVLTISGEGQAGKIGRLAGHRPLSPENRRRLQPRTPDRFEDRKPRAFSTRILKSLDLMRH
jgi:hypothetical protein